MMMQSVFWWRKPEYPEETTDLRQVTDETFHTYGDVGVVWWCMGVVCCVWCGLYGVVYGDVCVGCCVGVVWVCAVCVCVCVQVYNIE